VLSQRIKNIDASGIRRIFDLAAHLKDPVDLSIGQPDFDVPQGIKEKAIEAIKKGYNKYLPTQGLAKLREIISEKLRSENKIEAGPENVLITSGVSGGLFLSLNVLLDRGDEAIIFDPYFVSYRHILNLLEVTPKIIDIYPDFTIDPDKILQAISPHTRVIIINSPCNPTGKVYTKEELERISDIAERFGLFIVSDEIYEKFNFDFDFFSIGGLYHKVITLNGFSKSLGIPGWRVGYATGPVDVIQAMAKLQQYTFVCAPSFVQFALLSFLEEDIGPKISEYKNKRDLLYNSLKKYFRLVKPNGSFYAFPRTPNNISSQTFAEEAIKRKLLIVPGTVFSEHDTNFRVSFAAGEETLKRGIEILIDLSQQFG
jgi:aspartate aminotransferase/aminotransferase